MHFCHITISSLLTYTSVAFYTLHYGSISRSVTEGARGAQFHGRRIPLEALKYCGGHRMIVGAPKSPNKHFLQYSTFASERKTSGSNMWAPNLLLAPEAIYPRYAPVNQEISPGKKLIHSLLCCKTTMQTNCGLTNHTGNSPENGFSFSFWRLVKSCVSYKFSILYSYFYCCLSSSFQGGHQALKK